MCEYVQDCLHRWTEQQGGIVELLAILPNPLKSRKLAIEAALCAADPEARHYNLGRASTYRQLALILEQIVLRHRLVR